MTVLSVLYYLHCTIYYMSNICIYDRFIWFSVNILYVKSKSVYNSALYFIGIKTFM